MISRSLRQGGCTRTEYGLLTQLIRPKSGGYWIALPGTDNRPHASWTLRCWQSNSVDGEHQRALQLGHHWSGLLAWVPGVMP